MRVLQTLEFGLASGSFLVISALGFGLVARVNRFLNIAHAELISIAAFVTYFLQARAGWNVLAAAAAAILITAIVAVAVAVLVYMPLRHRGAAILLITSVGVTYILHGSVETLILPGVYALTLPTLASFHIAGILVDPIDVVIFVATGLCVVLLYGYLTWTRMGLAIRSFANDRELAAARGIDVNRVSIYVWAAAGVLAGVAGVLFALRSSLTTDLAFDQLLLIISVSILAGLGNVFGIVAAGLILGEAMDLSTLVLPTGYREAVAFAIVILVLLFRPQGLSRSLVRRREA